MNTWDTAKALKRMIEVGFFQSQEKPQGGRPEEGITWLSDKIGKTYSYISDLLGLLREQANVVKALKENKIKWTPVVEIYPPPIEKLDTICYG